MSQWDEDRYNIWTGLILAVIAHWSKIQNCFRNCDSLIIKAEQVLALVAFYFGISKPGLLVFKVLKYLLNKVKINMNFLPIPYSSEIEGYLEIGVAYGSQYFLSNIWDMAKDVTMCLQNYDCDENIGVFLMNIKTWACSPKEKDDSWSYDIDSVTQCEQIMNESPVLLLALFALILYLISSFMPGDYEDDTLAPIQPDSNSQNQSGDSPQPPVDPPNNPPQPTSQPEPANPSTEPANPPEPTTQPSAPPPPPTNPNPPENPEGQPQPPSTVQLMHAACPTCKKQFQVAYHNPTPVYCHDCNTVSKTAKNTNSVQSSNFNGVFGIKATDPPTDHTAADATENDDALKTRIAQAVKRRVNKSLKDLAKGVCRGCQDRLQKLMDCVNGPDGPNNNNEQSPDNNSLPNVCPTCGHAHLHD